MAINKKLRFEVFKRDGFICQYCGKHPPEVMLEVDHIEPKSKGGLDDINNLLTSCFDCNRGKSNIELKRIPGTLVENKEIIEERERQYIEYHKVLAKIEKRKSNEVNQVCEIYTSFFSRHVLSDSFKRNSMRLFIDKLNVFKVSEAMTVACEKFKGSKQYWDTGIPAYEAAVKYFCGICWNKIRENE